MHPYKKLISLTLILLLLAGAALAAETIPQTQEKEVRETIFASGETLYFWYADDALTDYLTNVSAAYYEESGNHVIPVLHTGHEYLEAINNASVHPAEDSPQMPDLYVISNDSLERAYLAGLATQITDGGICNTDTFPQTALDAVTYREKYVAYPFYYETSAFLYNKTYMEQAEREVPRTIDDILAFADEYDAPEQVEAVFQWVVSDIFYNYYFTGNYMIVGGEAGDDPTQVDIDNSQTKACLEVYQNLNQYFSIDTKEVTYDTVLQDFIDGKIVMTVATTDAVARLEEAKENGDFPYEYGITVMPDLTADLKGRSLSVTNGIVINGYSEKGETANDFAAFLTNNHADKLYENTGKIASRYGVLYDNRSVAEFMDEYESSISMPKLLGAGNFWIQLEVCFSRIWTGEDVETLLRELADQMRQQLS